LDVQQALHAQGRLTSAELYTPKDDQLPIIQEGNDDDGWSSCDETDLAIAAEMEVKSLEYNDELQYWQDLGLVSNPLEGSLMFTSLQETNTAVSKIHLFSV
jgi:hypothetical protein